MPYNFMAAPRRKMPVATRTGPAIYQAWAVFEEEVFDANEPVLLGEYSDPLTAAAQAREAHGLNGTVLIEVIRKGDPAPRPRRERFSGMSRALGTGKAWDQLSEAGKAQRANTSMKYGTGAAELARRNNADVEEVRRMMLQAAVAEGRVR